MTPFYGPLAHLNQIRSDKHKHNVTQYCHFMLLLAKRRGQCKNCDFLRLSVSDFYRNVLFLKVTSVSLANFVLSTLICLSYAVTIAALILKER